MMIYYLSEVNTWNRSNVRLFLVEHSLESLEKIDVWPVTHSYMILLIVQGGTDASNNRRCKRTHLNFNKVGVFMSGIKYTIRS